MQRNGAKMELNNIMYVFSKLDNESFLIKLSNSNSVTYTVFSIRVFSSLVKRTSLINSAKKCI